jgi:hypothetical protein
MLAATISSLTLVALSALVISYGIAYRLKSSISVLSIFLFLLSIWYLILILSIKMWIEAFNLDIAVGGKEIRSFVILCASCFFLYTTWKTNK